MQEQALTHVAVRAPEPWSRASTRIALLMAALLCVGTVMTASTAGASGFLGALAKRLIVIGLGLSAFLICSHTSYRWWRRHNLALLGLAVAGLVAVFIPGIGMCINGARRWINLGLPFGFQPSEFAKLALCIWTATYCDRNLDQMQNPLKGLLVPLSVVGLACLLILIEPDFGTAVLAGFVCLGVLLVMGARPLYVILTSLPAVPAFYFLVWHVPYRRERILAFLDPWQDPLGKGYQLIQSQIAIGSGQLFGRGLGASVQKAGFLPGVENDFIFSILAEELGFVGGLFVIILFVLLLWECSKVAARARDAFALALSTGLTLLTTGQAAAHIAVVTGSVPTKGLGLPLVSAGGTAVILSMAALGIIVNIARSVEEPTAYTLEGQEEDMPAYERAAYDMGRRLVLACTDVTKALLRRDSHRYGN